MTTREINVIENFVRDRLGDEYSGINFKPNFINYDIDIVILTKNHGFIRFSVRYQDLLDKETFEAHEFILNGLKDAIEKEMSNDGTRESSAGGTEP